MNTHQVLAFWTPGPTEIIVIGVVMLLIFGNRIPEVMRSLGRGLTHFKKGLRDTEDDIRKELDAGASAGDSSGGGSSGGESGKKKS